MPKQQWPAYGVAAWIVLSLTIVLGGCGARMRAVERYPELARYSGRRIDDVKFVGGAPFKADTLSTLVETQRSRCSLLGLPLCLPFNIGRRTYRLSLDVVLGDIERLTAFYRYSGYFGTTVTPTVKEKDSSVVVTFAIHRADPVRLAALNSTGLDPVLNADSLARQLPLRQGQIFHLGKFNNSATRIVNDLQALGHPYAQVLRNYDVDTTANSATATLNVLPGPRVVVDSIAVFGAEHLGRRNALRQLSFKKGDLLRATKLAESQRNLYSLELVQLARVSVGPDSLHPPSLDSTSATVFVRIVEAKVHQVDAAVGFGTVECLRSEVMFVNRSFLGGARRLALNAAASKIGVSGTRRRTGNALCRAFANDTFSNRLDYRLSADMTQPYFLNPRNHLTLRAFAERVSEPSLYQRQAVGARALVTRRLAPRTILTSGVDFEYGRTLATVVVFCTAFELCTPEDIVDVTRRRWRNTVGTTIARDRTDYVLDPSSGSLLGSGLAWAAPWLGSDVTFLRWTGDAALYRELKEDWVLATSLRLGNFFRTVTTSATDDFLPPEERFYAGGASTVRGYARNQLGPGVYVTDTLVVDPLSGKFIPAPNEPLRFVPLGGTALAVANVELRFPSPVSPRRIRLAAFIDAGSVGTGNILQLNDQWRVTPGLGIRVQTPVGPARVDLAYNPYRPQIGELFLSKEQALTLVRDDFRPARRGFFKRFEIHIGIGQAF